MIQTIPEQLKLTKFDHVYPEMTGLGRNLTESNQRLSKQPKIAKIKEINRVGPNENSPGSPVSSRLNYTNEQI